MLEQNQSIGDIAEEIYLFDISAGCTFFASTRRKRREYLGKSLYDVMSEEGVDELVEYLMSYGEKPIFVKTSDKISLVIPSTVPAASIGVFMPCFKSKSEFRAFLRKYRFDAVCSRELCGELGNTFLKAYSKNIADTGKTLLENPFERLKDEHFAVGDISEMLERYVLLLSRFTGCGVRTYFKETIFAHMEVDMSLYVAFVMSAMLIALEISTQRSVTFIYDTDDYGVHVQASMPIKGSAPETIPTVDSFRMITDRKHMPLDYFPTDGIIHIRFCISIFDLAILGLKSPEAEQAEREQRQKEIIEHYDLLIDENNDPVHDSKPLRDYMDKWDGRAFVDYMCLNKEKSVLEIGVGTGRIALRVAPECRELWGIDISPKTVSRARENLCENKNVSIICDDFLTHDFGTKKFDVIYSSLTFMHIAEKERAIEKVCDLLKPDGRLVLSIDKNQQEYIDIGISRIKIYPDTPENISFLLEEVGFENVKRYESEHAYIFVT